MFIKPQFKGYIYAFVATIALANVYIFSKAGMREIEFEQFAFYWFGLAIIWNGLYIWWKKKITIIRALTVKVYLIIALIGLFEVIGTYSFFFAIKIIENPANVSFLANLVPIFVILIAVTFLKERYNTVEIIGIVLTLFGTFIISYKGGGNEIFMKGSGRIVLASFSFAVATIIAKKHIRLIDPVLLSINRVFFLFILAIAILLYSGRSLIIPQYALMNITIGSLLGPFLTAIASYTSLVYIEASRSSIIQSTKGLFVIVGAIIYFGLMPQVNELIGGFITILGVISISVGKAAILKLRKNRIKT